jgi:methyl-accepting chemotaxis protein
MSSAISGSISGSGSRSGPGLAARARRLTGGLFARLLLSILAITLGLAVALAIVLSDQAGSSLRGQAKAAKADASTLIARNVSAWATNRTQDVRAIANELAATTVSPSRLRSILSEFPSLSGARVYDTAGVGRVASGTGAPPIHLVGSSWFDAAGDGRAGFSPLVGSGDRERLYVAVPLAAGGRASAPGARSSVLVASAPISDLRPLLGGAATGRTGEALIVNASHRLVISSIASRTSGAVTVDSVSARRALSGQSGAVVEADYTGHQVVAGFAAVPALHWGVIIKQDTSVALAAVSRQRRLALELIILGLLAAVGLALIVARLLSRPLIALQQAATAVSDGDLSARVASTGATETRRLGESFNAMVADIEVLLGTLRSAGTEVTSSAAELSAAAEQLASTTTQQSAASTQTSSTMEELSRTSSVIAEHADGVAERCVATQEALREAESGMHSSSERTMALAKQVDEISGILELIDTIAEKTAVLSLNAAIEAARAGESGAGFTVVSEEVGRLAERSKASAAQIAKIVRATQHDASATVMAMEAGGKQMRRGLDLMDEVTTAANQVQLTTQQQRTATSQVVETMASLSESNRQTSATTIQIAESAANLTGIASELESSVSVVEVREEDRSHAPRRSRPARSPAAGPSAPHWIPD